jgi:hypothetical protein
MVVERYRAGFKKMPDGSTPLVQAASLHWMSAMDGMRAPVSVAVVPKIGALKSAGVVACAGMASAMARPAAHVLAVSSLVSGW